MQWETTFIEMSRYDLGITEHLPMKHKEMLFSGFNFGFYCSQGVGWTSLSLAGAHFPSMTVCLMGLSAVC